MIKKFHVYDLDGTLIDSSHRYRTLPNGDIDLSYWRQMCKPHLIMRDKLLPLAAQYRRDLRDSKIYTVIATARVMSPTDFLFIQKKLGNPNHFIHRLGNHDARPDALLKFQGLRGLINLRQFQNAQRAIWEDNKTVLAMAKELNFICHQC